MKLFRNAPVSKILLFGTIIITVLNGTSHDLRSSLGGLSRSTIENGEYWRLFTSQWPTEDMGSLIVMCFLIYSYRYIERMMGSGTFCMFLILSSLFGMLTRYIAAVIYPCADIPSGPVSGPYHFAFGLLPIYFAYVPSITLMSFSITRNISIPISEKVPQYIAALLLAVVAGVRSWALVPLSLAFGIVYLLPFLKCKRLRLPRALRNFCSRRVRPLIEGTSRDTQPTRYHRPGRHAGGMAFFNPALQRRPIAQFMDQMHHTNGFGGENIQERAPTPTANAPVDEGSVATLVEMGFSEEMARRALRETNGNVEQAIGRLVA